MLSRYRYLLFKRLLDNNETHFVRRRLSSESKIKKKKQPDVNLHTRLGWTTNPIQNPLSNINIWFN